MMAINLTAAMPAQAASVRLEAHSPHQITTDISFADMIMVIPLASPQSIAASTTLNVGPLNMLHLVLLLACAAIRRGFADAEAAPLTASALLRLSSLRNVMDALHHRA